MTTIVVDKKDCIARTDSGVHEGGRLVGLALGGKFHTFGERTLAAAGAVDAIGSGADFALGALLHGASAWEAVEIACRIDTGSDLPVVQREF